MAEAGAFRAITISTNMAGRGTDIRLGGAGGEDYERVAALGGLYVIGANRHESRRIDDQLRGRAVRQGDPGSSRFFISLEDELLARYKIADSLPKRYRTVAQAEPVDSALLRRQVDRAQRIVEGQNFDIRQTLYRYSNFLDKQRQVMALQRRQYIDGTIPPTVFAEGQLAVHQELLRLMSEEVLLDLERRLMLQAIDDCWADHLEAVTEIRDSIHLAEVGGLDPFREFLKQASGSFQETLVSIDQRALEKSAALNLVPGGISLEKLGLYDPSSTWTYLVDDQAFSDRLTAQLIGTRNVGFSAMAAFSGPLLMLWAFSQRFGRRR